MAEMKRVSSKEYLDFLNENEGKLEFSITDISDPPMSYGWVKGEYSNIVCKAYCYDGNECDYWIDEKYDVEEVDICSLLSERMERYVKGINDVWWSEEEIKAWVEQDPKHRTSGTTGTFRKEEL